MEFNEFGKKVETIVDKDFARAAASGTQGPLWLWTYQNQFAQFNACEGQGVLHLWRRTQTGYENAKNLPHMFKPDADNVEKVADQIVRWLAGNEPMLISPVR